jgi:DNA-binding NarL/FixJ family response regulator
MSADAIKVALVEDSKVEREAISFLIHATPGFACVGALVSGEEALEKLPALGPDVVLMDIHLPGISGIDCIRQLKERLPSVRIMMLTVFEDHERIFKSLAAGATGYLVKKTPPAKLLEAIQELHNGGAPMSGQIARQVVAVFQEPAPWSSGVSELSPREQEILRLLAQGLIYKEIADQLGISFGTVRTHICRIYEKLHVHSRHEAAFKVSGRADRRFDQQ